MGEWQAGFEVSQTPGMKEEEALSGAGGKQTGDSGSAREDGIARTTVGGKGKVKKNS